MIKNKYFTLTHIALLLFSFSILFEVILIKKAHAQQSDFQIWSLVTADISIDEGEKKWLIYLETQARAGDDASDFERILLRPAIGYNLNPNLTFFLGYAWTPTFLNTNLLSEFGDEHRIWQQIIYKHQTLNLNWLHRLRQEQRFLENASSAANRTRYLLKASYPLENNYGLAGYNEIFVNLNSVKRGPTAGFDRWRFFVGPYLKVNNARYEFGYVGEFGRRFGDDERFINALFLSANFKY